MMLYNEMKKAVISNDKSIFIYGENRDMGLPTLLLAIRENLNYKKILVLTNSLKNVPNFNLGIKKCSSEELFSLGTNTFRFGNLHKHWMSNRDNIVIVYPADGLLLDNIHKNAHEMIDRVLSNYVEKVIFLTEYIVEKEDLEYMSSKVDKSIEIIDDV